VVHSITVGLQKPQKVFDEGNEGGVERGEEGSHTNKTRSCVCVDCGEDHGEDEDEDEDTEDHEPRRMRRSLEKRGTEVRTSSLGGPTAAQMEKSR
jgi:hypothetical protein